MLGPSSRNWRNHDHGSEGWFMDPNTDHDDGKKEEINKPHVSLEIKGPDNPT